LESTSGKRVQQKATKIAKVGLGQKVFLSFVIFCLETSSVPPGLIVSRICGIRAIRGSTRFNALTLQPFNLHRFEEFL
jgi:hypothetical protein